MHAEANFRNAEDRATKPGLELFRTSPKKMELSAGAGDGEPAIGERPCSIGLFRRSNWRATLRP